MYLLLPIILHHCCRLSCTIVANYCVFLIAIFSAFLITDYTSVWQNTGSTIIVDLIDPVTKDLVWRGQFNGFKRDDLSKRDEKIHTMIKKILDQYPPDMQSNR